MARQKWTPFFRGWCDRDARASLSPGWLWLAQNIIAANERDDAPPRCRPGIKPVNATAIAESPCQGLFVFRDGTDEKVLYAGSSKLYMSDNWPTALTTGMTLTWARNDLFQFVKTKGRIFAVNGSDEAGLTDANMRIDIAARVIYPMGGDEPSAAPTAAEQGAGNVTGNVLYITTDWDPVLDRETDQSDSLSVVTVDQIIRITPGAMSADATYTHFKVYRTTDGGSNFLYVGTATHATGYLDDDTLDAGLGIEYGDAGDDNHSRGPRSAAIATMEDGRVLLLGDVENGYYKRIHAARDADHPEEFNLSDYMEAGSENGSRILCAVPSGTQMLVVAEDGLYLINPKCTVCDLRVPDARGVGPWCAVSTPYGPIVVDPRGPRLFKGYTTDDLSLPIKGTWDALDKDWLPYCATAYDPTTDHVYIGVDTTDGAERNLTILALDCRTLDRRISVGDETDRSFAWPRWAKWTIRGEALAGSTWATAKNGKCLVAFGQGMVGEMERARKQDGPYNLTPKGTATSATANTLSDTAATFLTTGSGLKGVNVYITGGTGAGQEREITSNTATVLTLASNWTTTPAAGSTYQIGAIPMKMRHGEIDAGMPWVKKLFRRLFIATEQP